MTDHEAINACPMCDEEGLLHEGEAAGRCSHQLIDALLLNGVMCQSCATVLTRAELEALLAEPMLDPSTGRPYDPDQPHPALPPLLCADCGGRLADAESFEAWLAAEWLRGQR